jgi:hypothetical protein
MTDDMRSQSQSAGNVRKPFTSARRAVQGWASNATQTVLDHDHGRIMADLACAIADGSEVISDFRVLADRRELFGLVASVPTV